MRSLGIWLQRGIGDGVLFLPVLRQLRRQYPEMRLHVWAHPASLSVMQALGVIDSGADVWHGLTLPHPLDLVVGYDHPRLGFDIAAKALGAHDAHVFDRYGVPGEWMGHYQYRALSTLVELDSPAWSEPFVWPHVPASPRQTILLNPFSSLRSKDWQVDHWVRLARRLQSAGHPVAFLIPADKEVPHATTIPVLRLPFEAAVAQIASCAAYIGGDTGTTHIAAALGRPTVVVFGPTTLSCWHPIGRTWTAVQTCTTVNPHDDIFAHPHDCYADMTLGLVTDALRYQMEVSC